MRRTRQVMAILALAAACGLPLQARAAGDGDLLAGMKELKIAFDIQEGDGKRLLNRLTLIDETRQDLVARGIRPHFVLSFRGAATRLVQTDPGMMQPQDREIARVIATKLDEMRDAPGVDGLELCAIAIRGQGTRADRAIPAVKVVANTWITLAAYQARGYAYIVP